MIATASQMREAEQQAVAKWGMSEDLMMERAGSCAWDWVRVHFGLSENARLGIVCGPGANGGDGLVLARWARSHGLQVEVVFPEGAPTKGLAANQWERLGGWGISVVEQFSEGLDLRVDAMFGTGLSRPLTGIWATWAERLQGNDVCALDLPSGLPADGQIPTGPVVRAGYTVTFGAAKPGLLLDPGRDFAGHVQVVDLGLPQGLRSEWGRHLDPDWSSAHKIVRSRSSHKGNVGRVLHLAGSPLYRGACFLAARAALRSGAGMVRVLTHAEVAPQVALVAPEAIGTPWNGEMELPLAGVEALLVGPGWGQGAPELAGLTQAIQSDLPLVLDADALNLLVKAPELKRQLVHRRGGTILTPHLGEAARLMGCTVPEIQADLLGSARQLSQHTGSVVVLKSATTIVMDPAGPWAIYNGGHPGMALAGMGDALAGVLSARLAARVGPFMAACESVWAHGEAGFKAGSRLGALGLGVGDLIEDLPHIWKSCAGELG